MMAAIVAACVAAVANDGVYYVSGSMLVPVDETDIRVTGEVLTIDIGDDYWATVDVLYELYNGGNDKTVTMGFEADLPYEDGVSPLNPKGIHPFIHNFTATLNGERLSYTTGVVMLNDEGNADMHPLDMTKWHYADNGLGNSNVAWDMVEGYITNGKDTIANVACAYYFKANIRKGVNNVHHTYRYRMSSSVSFLYGIPYKLEPITRWANRQVDDFTLRITSKGLPVHFIVTGDDLNSGSFKVVRGKGKVRRHRGETFDGCTEVSLRRGTVEWKAMNFRPKGSVEVISADVLMEGLTFSPRAMMLDVTRQDFIDFYHRTPNNDAEMSALKNRIMRNMPYARRGYVFNDKRLRDWFNRQWWYMADPEWEMSTDDFTEQEMWMVFGD